MLTPPVAPPGGEPPTRRPAAGTFTLSALVCLTLLCGLVIVAYRVWRWPRAPRPQRTWNLGPGEVTAFSPGGKYALVAAGDRSPLDLLPVRIFDLAAGPPRPLFPEPVLCFGFSPDERWLAVSRAGQAGIFDTDTGRWRALADPQDPAGGPLAAAHVTAMDFNAGGDLVRGRLLYGGEPRQAVWPVAGGAPVVLPPAIDSWQFAGGDRLLTADASLFSVGGGALRALGRLPDHGDDIGRIDSLVVSGDGRRAMFVDTDNRLIWVRDTASGRTISTLWRSDVAPGLVAARFLPGGRQVLLVFPPEPATGNDPYHYYYRRTSHLLLVYDLAAWQTAWSSEFVVAPLAACDPTGRLLAMVGPGFRTARLRQLADGRFRSQLTHPDGVTALGFSADGRHVFTGGEGGAVCRWSAWGALPWSYILALPLMLGMIVLQAGWWLRNAHRAGADRRERIRDWLAERRAAASGRPLLPVRLPGALSEVHVRRVCAGALGGLRLMYFILAAFAPLGVLLLLNLPLSPEAETVIYLLAGVLVLGSLVFLLLSFSRPGEMALAGYAFYSALAVIIVILVPSGLVIGATGFSLVLILGVLYRARRGIRLVRRRPLPGRPSPAGGREESEADFFQEKFASEQNSG